MTGEAMAAQFLAVLMAQWPEATTDDAQSKLRALAQRLVMVVMFSDDADISTAMASVLHLGMLARTARIAQAN